MAVTETFIQFFVGKWPVILTSVLACLVAVGLRYVLQTNPISDVPLVGKEIGSEEKRRQVYLAGAKKLYVSGYHKFKDGVFRVTTSKKSPVVVVAPKFLSELRKLPDEVLSFDGAIAEGMHVKYTKIPAGNPVIPHTVKASLTPALVRLNASIAEEVQEALRSELPPCDDWTPIPINRKLLRIVAMVSGRVFIGPELCRSEEYLDAAINYTVELMEAQRAISQLKSWQRPFMASRLPQVKRLEDRAKEADAFLRPVVQARMKLTANDPKPDDMLQWLMDAQTKFDGGAIASSKRLAKIQLGISFAAIHTTTLTTTNAYYNLAAMPELVPELREEVRTVLAAHNNIFTSVALQEMKKLDSFLKETLRFHPASLISYQRKVLQPIILSNGQTIPAGVIIEVPAHAISRDPDMFPDPEKFDAFRFYNLRQKAREDGVTVDGGVQNQFVSVSQRSLTFGYGRHACPGRFFAANEIKMILANTLLEYDIKCMDDTDGRYPNKEFATLSIPDPTKLLLFKRLGS